MLLSHISGIIRVSNCFDVLIMKDGKIVRQWGASFEKSLQAQRELVEKEFPEAQIEVQYFI